MLRKPALWIVTALLVLVIAAAVILPRLGQVNTPGIEKIDLAPDSEQSLIEDSRSLAAVDPGAPVPDKTGASSVDALADLTLTTDPTTTAQYSGDFQVLTSEFFTETGRVLFAVVPVDDMGWFCLVGTDAMGNTVMWTAPTRQEAIAQIEDMLAATWPDGAPPHELVGVE